MSIVATEKVYLRAIFPDPFGTLYLAYDVALDKYYWTTTTHYAFYMDKVEPARQILDWLMEGEACHLPWVAALYRELFRQGQLDHLRAQTQLQIGQYRFMPEHAVLFS